ncbi:MAG: hypothetical protein KatS3mg045_1917 [Bellilinea sp.]|nr:MAG: hypothetical protein KatS3mg045_1917 [Bellilinea sp.]
MLRSRIVNNERLILYNDKYDGLGITKYYYPLHPRAWNYVAIRLSLPPRARYVRATGWSDGWNGTGMFLKNITRMTRAEFRALYEELAELIKKGEHARAIERFHEIYDRFLEDLW